MPDRLQWLEPGERRLLPEAAVALPLAALALRIRTLQQAQSTLQRWTGVPRHEDGDAAGEGATARRIAWCVSVAAAYGPWPANCLQRSLVLWWFLQRRGIGGDLRIGVRRGSDGALDFHAWVEHRGDVINDRRDVRRQYATFDRAIAPPGATFRR